MRKFEDLQIWQRSHALTLAIYKASATFPKEELYSLTSQIRRSASSIPTNIAEGCGRNTEADFARFLVIAMGSSSELAYQLILAKDLNYISEEAFNTLNSELVEIRKMVNAYIQKVKPFP
ncbi:four helix bundle protein [Telluribacter sp.]|jgi:four helix bundle protein|uniref:four helix bundle protein n=1 Tax=Telluribacter sp. TaxID=1978767 RepID=UPI002E0EA2E5|nr:four helix bundle protein [Telluribacter sp.]